MSRVNGSVVPGIPLRPNLPRLQQGRRLSSGFVETLGSRLRTAWNDQTGRDSVVSLTYFAIGFAPITALAMAIFGFLPLYLGALLLVVPATVVGIALGLRFPEYGGLALRGFVIGLIAVTLYDSMRVPLILTGMWGDFIPKIGMWLLNSPDPNLAVGYLWRYIGDGGAMGMAFSVAYALLRPRLHPVVAGTGFGIGIWLCLLGTLLFAPHGQQMLFPLTLTTFTLSLLGHLIYGASVGVLHRLGWATSGRLGHPLIA